MQLFVNHFVAHSDASSNLLINSEVVTLKWCCRQQNCANQQCLTKETDH